jgi:hypothetical protein
LIGNKENNLEFVKSYLEILNEELENYLDHAIDEYNNIKPHYFHKIYTPTEIYNQPELKNTKLYFEKLNKERIANNKNYSCGKVCP